MNLFNDLSKVKRSPIREIHEKVLSFPDGINLSLGENFFNPPSLIKKNTIKAILANKVKYETNHGNRLLRQNIAKYLYPSYQEEEVLITNGVTESLYSCCRTLLNAEDEVIIIRPYYSVYPNLVALNSAKIVYLDDIYQMQITSKTKLIIINSPNNPTGYIYSKEELDYLVTQIIGRNIFVISDETYDFLDYRNKFYSMSNYKAALKDQLLIVNGFSKSFGVSGYRIGYTLCSLNIMKHLKAVHGAIVSCISTPMQIGVQDFYKCFDYHKKIKKYFFRNLKLIIRFFKKHKIEYITPDGAFYICARLDYKLLLNDLHIATVGLSAFGLDDRFTRICYSVKKSVLVEALMRIEKAIEEKKIIP